MRKEIQQRIRLANVLQWQKRFVESNESFNEIVELCRSHPEAGVYLDFAIQHAGKNQFDQTNYLDALDLFEEALVLRRARNAPADQILSTKTAMERTKFLIKLNKDLSN